MPAAQQASGDFHLLNVTAAGSFLSTLNDFRNAGIIFKDAADKTVALGPVLTAPAISVLGTTGYARIRDAITIQAANYGRAFSADFQQTGSGASYRRANVQQTADFATGATATLDIPDLTGVTGWDNTWGLKAGTATIVTTTATGWSSSTGTLGTPWVEGGTYQSATKVTTITP